MWYRYDDDLKRAVLHAAARYECCPERGLTTMHLLEGLLAESPTVSQLLARSSGSHDAPEWDHSGAHDSIERLVDGPLPAVLTPQAREAVDRSYEIAATVGDGGISSEHLFLALTREPETSDAGRFLAQRQVSWQRAGMALMELQPHRVDPPAGVHVPGLAARRLNRKARGYARGLRQLALTLLRGGGGEFRFYGFIRRWTLDNPYPYYASMRRSPAHWNAGYTRWMITGYDDVTAAIDEPKLSQRVFAPSTSSRSHEAAEAVMKEFRLLHDVLDHSMLFSDAPEQPRQRMRVARRFTPAVIAQMRAQMESVVEELLDRVRSETIIDISSALAVPFPLLVIMDVLGVPRDKYECCHRWSTLLFKYIASETTLPEEVGSYQYAQEASAYFRSLIPERRAGSGSDVITMLLQPGEDGEYLSDDDVVANCIVLLTAGNETTTRIIGSGLLALLRHPEQMQRLRDDPSLMKSAVEEFLRLDSPVQWLQRDVMEDFTWRGHEMKKGQRMNIGLGAANRDPAQFPDPDRLDIARTPNRHVAFGRGPHFCLGSALSRMEADVAFTAILKRFPNLKLVASPKYFHDGLAFRGVRSLRIRVQ